MKHIYHQYNTDTHINSFSSFHFSKIIFVFGLKLHHQTQGLDSTPTDFLTSKDGTMLQFRDV